ncbi:hypothetical protein B0H21DRAFT_435183 [Amylocystis lapponica]|nr:hypothetical protein B0H21DRAFT_435183 [Amylocystis lapponica]
MHSSIGISSRSHTTRQTDIEPHSWPRTRVVEHQWLRDPDGPILPRPPPLGIRTPSGIIWGHSLDDFMWIQRVPGVDVMTIWSRSMIKELGERYDEAQFEHPEPLPRRRRPWPVLRLQKGDRTWVDEPLGAMDEGCDLEHDDSNLRKYSIRGDPFEDDEADDRPEMDLSLRRPFDEDNLKLTVPNVSKVMSPLGVPYVRLWVPEFGSNFTKVREMGVVDEFVLIGHDLKTGLARAANEVGMVDVFVENRPSGDEGPRQRVLYAIHPDEFTTTSQTPAPPKLALPRKIPRTLGTLTGIQQPVLWPRRTLYKNLSLSVTPMLTSKPPKETLLCLLRTRT